MHTPRIPAAIAIVTLAMLFAAAAGDSQGAGWGRRGHGVLTYDAATERVGVNRDIARVMALGSIAPDYFEFDNPAAHAQTRDPDIDASGKPILDSQRYDESQRESFRASRTWREHYFNAAVQAGKAGHRERAALLLGYALHNVEDYGTHRGMPNALHAGLDNAGHSPDRDEARLASSKILGSIYVERFRDEIGADNWKLFNGEAVRRPGQAYATVPEPLTAVTGLSGWDPRSGFIPPKPGYVLHDPVKNAVGDGLALLAHPMCAPNCQIAAENLREKGANFIDGFLSRQNELAKLLDTREIGIALPAGMKAPEPKNADSLRQFVADGVLFAVDPRSFENGNLLYRELWQRVVPGSWKDWLKRGYITQYALMSDRERLFLRQATFDSMVRDEIQSLIRERSEKQVRLQNSYKLTLEELKEMRQEYEAAHQKMIERKAREERERKAWRENQQTLLSVGRPVIDGRPPPPPTRSSPGGGGSSSGGSTAREPREPREPSGGRIDEPRGRICNKFGIC